MTLFLIEPPNALTIAANNVLYCLLADYLAGKIGGFSRSSLNKDSAASFLGWVEGRRFPPKAEQKRFVDRVFGEEPIVMLQGPPGTGKTETLQLAVFAHIAAHRSSSKCRVLMVAPTHKAIQEFVSKLAALLARILQWQLQRPKRFADLPSVEQRCFFS